MQNCEYNVESMKHNLNNKSEKNYNNLAEEIVRTAIKTDGMLSTETVQVIKYMSFMPVLMSEAVIIVIILLSCCEYILLCLCILII